MPSDQPILSLEDIRQNIDLIEDYTRHYSFQRFSPDQKCHDAVERCLLRISEAAKKLEGLIDSIAPDQPWSAIRAIGNVLRHEYDTVNPSIIWQIISEDLKPLKHAVEAALGRLQNDPSKSA